ncbi:hypothetical protein AC578_3312 [Pseudocercospora eumusae]|uniref:F-box domain-containing protein n=1 Tax=Pseudocercospora eumusae TaxID=321146 RepID=A0A139HCJ8_9PEZI|nr:hypothetical protein AC578_3312 [Pseudocercospora eumusae]
MSAAAHAVFATVEILELILLELTVRSLARSQTVSKHWANTIAESKKLHGQLTFREPRLATSDNRIVTINPELPRQPSMPTSTTLESFMPEHLDPNDPSHIAIDQQTLFAITRTDSRSGHMLVSQPPITRFDVYFVFEKQSNVCSSLLFRKTIEAKGGITFGILASTLKASLHEAKKQRRSSREHRLVDYVWLDLGDAVPDTSEVVAEALKHEFGRLP